MWLSWPHIDVVHHQVQRHGPLFISNWTDNVRNSYAPLPYHAAFEADFSHEILQTRTPDAIMSANTLTLNTIYTYCNTPYTALNGPNYKTRLRTYYPVKQRFFTWSPRTPWRSTDIFKAVRELGIVGDYTLPLTSNRNLAFQSIMDVDKLITAI